MTVDAEGPSALPSRLETADPTAAWEEATGLKYDDEMRAKVDAVAARLERDELDRADQIATQNSEAIAKASRFGRRRKPG
jgi:hypothetical protein